MILTSLCLLIIVAFLLSFVLPRRTSVYKSCLNESHANQTLRDCAIMKHFSMQSKSIYSDCLAKQSSQIEAAHKKQNARKQQREFRVKESVINEFTKSNKLEESAVEKGVSISNATSPKSQNPDSHISSQTQRYIIFWVAFCFFGTMCFMPIIYGTSIAKLWYSYFDSPSFLACMLLCVLVLRMIISHCSCALPLWIQKILWQAKLNCWSACVLVLYGALLYGGALGMIDYDIYHLAPMWQGMISFILLILLYLCQRFIGILGLFALALFCLFGGENVSVLEAFVCPFLWFYCVIFVVICGICNVWQLCFNAIK